MGGSHGGSHVRIPKVGGSNVAIPKVGGVRTPPTRAVAVPMIPGQNFKFILYRLPTPQADPGGAIM